MNMAKILSGLKFHFNFQFTSSFVGDGERRHLVTSSSAYHPRRGSNGPSVFREMLGPEEEHMSLEEANSEVNFRQDIHMEGLSERRDFAEMDMKNQCKLGAKMNIRRKYFKDPIEPCLLTYDMKTALRNLNSIDPRRWTPLELSHAFPISELGVKKLLKYRVWPKSEEQIKEHDLEVLKNWKRATKQRIGSIGLLKKTVEKRFSDITKVKLPVATMGSPEEISAFLEGLTFTPEDDLFLAQDKAREERMMDMMKKKYPFKETFKDIITNYKVNVERVNDHGIEKEKEVKDIIPKCHNLEEILPSPTTSSSDSPLSSQLVVGSRTDSKPMFKGNHGITYDEFIKQRKKRQRRP